MKKILMVIFAAWICRFYLTRDGKIIFLADTYLGHGRHRTFTDYRRFDDIQKAKAGFLESAVKVGISDYKFEMEAKPEWELPVDLERKK